MEVKLESHEMRRVVVCTMRKLKLKLGRKVGEARDRKNTAHTRLGRRNRLSKENTEKKLKRFFFGKRRMCVSSTVGLNFGVRRENR